MLLRHRKVFFLIQSLQIRLFYLNCRCLFAFINLQIEKKILE